MLEIKGWKKIYSATPVKSESGYIPARYNRVRAVSITRDKKGPNDTRVTSWRRQNNLKGMRKFKLCKMKPHIIERRNR